MHYSLVYLITILTLSQYLLGNGQFVSASWHHQTNTTTPNSVEHEVHSNKKVIDLMNRKRDEQLRGSSIIFGLAKIADDETLSRGCYANMKKIEEGILNREVWAMKVLDASAHKEAGFIWGQNYWLGSKKGCEAVTSPVSITLSKQFKRAMKQGLITEMAPFDMGYRIVHLEHNSPWQVEIKFMTERVMHIGLCLPRNCTTNEIYNITQTYFDHGILDHGNLYDLHAEVINVKDLTVSDGFFAKKSLRIVGAFLGFTALMIVCAAFLGSNASDGRPSAIWNFIKCFDLATNCRKLFAVREVTTSSIPVINGLRSISCLWILLFHVIWYMYFTVDNKTFLISYGEHIFFQYVSTAPLLVDVFFTISGFLLTFNFLSNQKNVECIKQNSLGQNAKVFSKMIFHRYLRLAPLYLVITGMVEIFTAYAEDVSIFHIHDRYDQTCSNYWWRNILFIQNFFHHEQLCLSWTWSLACEMQFFCLSAGLLFLYVKHPQKAKAVFVTSLVGMIAWTYVAGFWSQYELSFDVIYNTGTQIYINPFVRVMPYLLGIATGWYMATYKEPVEISSTREKALWNAAIVVFFVCIYSTFKRDISFMSTMAFLVIGRLLFSTAICWTIFGSATGRSCWWSRILESHIFQHLNKLSYAIYLLNPFIIGVVFSLSSTSTHADPILLCVLSSGFVVIVYLCSIVFSLAFEVPYCNFSSQLLRRKVKMT